MQHGDKILYKIYSVAWTLEAVRLDLELSDEGIQGLPKKTREENPHEHRTVRTCVGRFICSLYPVAAVQC